MYRKSAQRAGQVWLTFATVIMLAYSPLHAQGSKIKYGQDHPDGSLGHLAMHSAFGYYSLSGESPLSISDFQETKLRLDWIALSQVTATFRLNYHHQDSSHFRFLAGFKYYFSDPMSPNANLNPDGVVGRPSISMITGPGFTESKGDGSISFRTEITLPISRRMSFHSSYNYYSEPRTLDIDQVAIGAVFYPKETRPDQPFLNPDGPLGALLFRVETGGGGRGWFGQIGTGFPFNQHWTIHTSFRYAKDNDFNRQILSASLRISVYPGSVFAKAH